MTPKSIADIIREVHTRNAAMRDYAAMLDRFADLEQMYAGLGRLQLADDSRELAVMARRAYQAEFNDPEPRA